VTLPKVELARHPLEDRQRPLDLIEKVRFAIDSALEGIGFEPSVPRKAPDILVVSGLVRALFPSAENQAKATCAGPETLVVSCGTDGSNPAPSSGESANLRSLSMSEKPTRGLRFQLARGARAAFWLADNYILQGRYTDARRTFERLLDLRNDVGLLAEYDPRARRQVGNFPQAFPHVALINTAHNLARAYGPAQHRAESEETVGAAASRPVR
jgi:hypothetical protein